MKAKEVYTSPEVFDGNGNQPNVGAVAANVAAAANWIVAANAQVAWNAVGVSEGIAAYDVAIATGEHVW